VAFWRRLALDARGAILELGCGTGRLLDPLARAGVRVVGVDRSGPMLDLARARLGARLTRPGVHARRGIPPSVRLVRADIRALPFRDGAGFALVMAPYGILQSLLSNPELDAAIASVARATSPGAMFAIDLVPDLPRWQSHRRRVAISGTRGRARLTLVESVEQDRRRGLTVFDQEFIERAPGRPPVSSRFSLVFRTVSVPSLARRVERAGFRVEATLGSYTADPWHPAADVWIVLARRI
jgi:SAM-dependent methyltransferase